jgi:hypothetical protein
LDDLKKKMTHEECEVVQVELETIMLQRKEVVDRLHSMGVQHDLCTQELEQVRRGELDFADKESIVYTNCE